MIAFDGSGASASGWGAGAEFRQSLQFDGELFEVKFQSVSETKPAHHAQPFLRRLRESAFTDDELSVEPTCSIRVMVAANFKPVASYTFNAFALRLCEST